MKPSQAQRLIVALGACFAFWGAWRAFHSPYATDMGALALLLGLCALVAVCTPSVWKGLD